MNKYRLTTEDNPFDPFKNWDQWYFYDMSQGYNTCERIARITGMISEDLPYPIYDMIQENALDQLVETGAFNNKGEFVNYKKIKNPDFNEAKEKAEDI